MDISLKVVAKPVVFDHKGTMVRLHPGETAEANHPYVKAMPDYWSDFALTYEQPKREAKPKAEPKDKGVYKGKEA